MQALILTPMFASPFFEAKLNLETSDSSLFVDQGSGAFPHNQIYMLMFLRTLLTPG